MQSINFELLRENRTELASLGGFAEQYVHTDPSSALVKLRVFGELMVRSFYDREQILAPYKATFNDLLDGETFRRSVPGVVIAKFHSLRCLGNRAAHGSVVTIDEAHQALREAFDIACWDALQFWGVTEEGYPPYVEPPEPSDTMDIERLAAEKDAALAQLDELEAKANEESTKLQVALARTATAEKSADDMRRMLEAGIAAANALEFDEAATRKRLIDLRLAEAGWQVSPNGQSNDEVGQEIEVGHQPTETGKGYIDYVLWDDNGKPLAVIEAKKTSVSAERGKKQATLYADGLEKEHGQRPAIFYTNGYDITIWDDAQGYPPRPLFGFYSKDSLQYLVNFQRNTSKSLDTITPRDDIIDADRIYQFEAIKRVSERFTSKHRNALIVQATGSGKTRLAISLTDVLIRANWVKRVLFLCDRLELRKQAKNAYGEFLTEPITTVSRHTAKDRDKRIYIATYPSMMNIFQTFDVGFFDLIFADESHRSVYNVYGDLFRYFDCLQIGLTATPVEFIARNTYTLFGCENQDPTVYYPLERAVEEGFLVPYEVYTHTTQFLREGIKYDQLSEKQKQQIEEDGIDPDELEHEAKTIDRQVFNKDTNRIILRNLMENGIRDANGQNPGKTIIFARGHDHAVLIQKMFDEMFPQFGGTFCQVIDNYDPRAEQLIDDLKGEGHNDDLTIAISVDMLDTGIDIPEIVNLVFAKPIKSKVKFWQMIGRGTRLCPGLFGPSQDKAVFRIFDHWQNFEYFEQNRPEAEPSVHKPLMQRVFESRIVLAETSLNSAETTCFEIAIGLLRGDVASLPSGTISVREKWREIQTVTQDGVIEQFAPTTVQTLRFDIAPLMQWVNVRGHSDAYHLDLLMAEMQVSLLMGSSRFDDHKGDLLNRINSLRMNLNPVKEKADTIKMVRGAAFWNGVTVADLEGIRIDLRSIMQHKEGTGVEPVPPGVYDIEEDQDQIQTGRRSSMVRSIDLAAYRRRVEEVLVALFDTNPTLRKIRAGEAVSEDDLQALVSLVLTQNPDVDLSILGEFYPETAGHLDIIIRSIVGMDTEAVKARFTGFVQQHPSLTAKQTRFISLLQNHIAKNGGVEIDRLYEAPFTSIDSDGLDGVFPNEVQVIELLDIIHSFDPTTPQEGHPQ